MDVMGGIASRLRRRWLAFRGVHFEGAAWVRAVEIPRGHHAIRLGRNVALDRGVTILSTGGGRINIGACCYLNRHTMLDASSEIEVSEECMIGPYCYITDHDHDTSAPGSGSLTSTPIRIGRGCWLGAHVTVLKGVCVGDGTIIGAGSVVTKSLPSRVVAAGNPARILRYLDPDSG